MSIAVPDRVAIETPRGTVRCGDVLARETTIRDCRPVDVLTVEVEGHRFRVDAPDAVPVAG